MTIHALQFFKSYVVAYDQDKNNCIGCAYDNAYLNSLFWLSAALVESAAILPYLFAT